MKILITCSSDKSEQNVALNIIKYLINKGKDDLTVCVLDNNKNIIRYLKSKKIFFVNKNIDFFLNKIKQNEFNWLLNLWGSRIFSQNFLNKFKNNLNIHPSFLPSNRGKDPYVWSIINETSKGVSLHKMDKTIDGGNIYIRKKLDLNFPIYGKNLYEASLKLSKTLFIQNWLKIRNEKIKPKKYTIKKIKVNKRINLLKTNIIDLDNQSFKKEKNFLLNILARDFKKFSLKIKYKKKLFNLKVNIFK